MVVNWSCTVIKKKLVMYEKKEIIFFKKLDNYFSD